MDPATYAREKLLEAISDHAAHERATVAPRHPNMTDAEHHELTVHLRRTRCDTARGRAQDWAVILQALVLADGLIGVDTGRDR